MLKILAKTLPVWLLIISSASFGQKVQKKILDDGSEIILLTSEREIVCEAGSEDMTMVPLPDALRNRINARVKSSEFIVTYTGFTPEARDAFQYAVDIWAALFSSPVPVRVNATFTLLEAPAIGASKFTNAFSNFALAPKANTWYQMPLAEKIAGEDLNDTTEFDIDIEFNNSFTWYYDTANPEGIDETNLTDFATVVLHELGHALGFSSFGAGVDEVPPNSGTFVGDVFFGSYPIAYNTFLYTPTGENLVDDVPNGGAIMASVLTSSGLRFTGPTSSVRVHAPDPFNPGSSISHIDNLAGELMNPSLGPNGFIHSPGRALGMMHDMGWEFTYLNHEKIPSTENFDQTFEVVAEVYSDGGYDTASLQLLYSIDNFETDTVKVAMVPTGVGDNFSAIIPNPGKEVVYSYYLTATDLDNRIFTNPGDAPEERSYQFVAAIDDSIPQISHTQLDFLLPATTELKINASITDFFTGLDTAYVAWFINDTEQTPVGMAIDDPEFPAGWVGTLNFTSEFTVGDIIKYQIIAIDKSGIPLTAVAPGETEFYSINIEGALEPVTSYINDFNSPSTDFLGTSFSIYTEVGFPDGALHSPHPYEEAGEGNLLGIQYISQLRVPIIINAENSVITFDEIVLVEPGDENGFWDFVIIEASKDDGATWVPLVQGYDSRTNNDWLQRYNQGILDGQNSASKGTPELYRERTIDILGNGSFSAGETIQIQFRLFSDPFAWGWGWAIDNLNIQGEETVTAVSDYLDDENDLSIYPNPSVDGLFNIEATFSKPVPAMEIKVMDTMGRIIRLKNISSTGKGFSYQLDISDQAPGIYLINTSIGDSFLTKRIIKSN